MPEEISERKQRLYESLRFGLSKEQFSNALKALESVEEMIQPLAGIIPNDVAIDIFKCLVAQREVESSPDKYPDQNTLLGWFGQAIKYYQTVMEKSYPHKEQSIANLTEQLERLCDQFFQIRHVDEEINLIKLKWSPIKRLIDDITAPSFPQEPGAL